jgi:hypothetical protein
LALVSASGGLRITKLIFDIIMDPDSKDGNIKRIRNVVIFMVLCILIISLKEVAMTYYQ